MEAAGIALATLLGLIFGSFANVVVHRVPLKESIVHPGSRCPSCGVALRPRDNIPVVSWLALRGRCRNCGARISPRYPAIEILTGALFGLAAWRIRPTSDLIAYLPLLWVLVVLSFIDLEHKLLPNRIVFPSLIAGVVLLGVAAAFGPGINAWVRALAGAAIAFVTFLALAIISPRGMGMGDVKLAAVLGLSLAYQARRPEERDPVRSVPGLGDGRRAALRRPARSRVASRLRPSLPALTALRFRKRPPEPMPNEA